MGENRTTKITSVVMPSAWIFLLVAQVFAVGGCADAHTLDEVLVHLRLALGHADDDSASSPLPGVIEVRGEIRQAGDSGRYRLLFDGAGSFREEADLRLGYSTVLVGDRGWSTDYSGDTRRLLMEELEQTRLLLALLSGQWVTVDSPFEIEKVSESSGRVGLQVGITGGLRPFTVFVDSRTWMPRSFSRATNAGRVTYVMTDFRETAGVVLAHSVVRDWDGVAEGCDLETASVLDDAPDSLFAVELSHPTDFRFDAELPADVETKILDTGHVLVRPWINGHRVGWFFLDTGADAHIISPRLADRLGLEAFGEIEATGTGGTITVDFRQAGEIRVGPMTMDAPVLAAIDLGGIISGVEGIIGYPLFRRSIVEIDPGAESVRIHPPERYPGEVPAWTTLTIADRSSFLTCRFEGGEEGLFCLDTGHSMAATFHTPAVDRYRLLDGRRTREAGGTGGVGGRAEKRRGRVDWFEIGEVRFTRPEVDFSRATHGGFCDPYSVGHVGMGLLYYFRLVIDYSGGRIALIPPD